MATVSDRAFFGHPRGLSTLFFTEMWERFSYYGMRALLILFMTAPVAAGGLGFDTAKAGPIYALYVSSVYLLSLPGGWIADRVLGLRRTVFVGGVIIMAGHICLAVPSMTTFYLGLVLIASGTGLLKPNVSVLVGKLYGPEDVRRDAGFSIFYMGINTGAFLAPLVTGWLAQSDGFKRILSAAGFAPESSWHWGFGAAAVGMFLGLVQY
ncbi:MAG: peptide MFS transporter, partial [Gemmatimonadales bacterium]